MEIDKSAITKHITGNKYKYSLLVGILTFLGAIVISFAAIMPLYKSAVKITKDVDDNKAKLEQLKERKSKLERLSQREQAVREEEKRVSNALPQGSEVGRLFIELDQLVNISGGKVSGFSKGLEAPSVPGSVVRVTTYTIPVEFPNYFSLKSFITNSQNALRLLNITSINISASDDGRVGASLNTTTYSR